MYDSLTGQNPELTLQKEGTFTDENSDEFAQVGETITYTFMSLLNSSLFYVQFHENKRFLCENFSVVIIVNT
ncbi:MAG: hypothetical protein COB60_02145 [Flavobacteriaceae bacterium]|nr:MAG: hypothetical protein COB60_02145 [Flavobacteriaceae bacterium]